ncbi:MAG: hypothetical protein Alis3KO_06270 [Aliiglaciecola sp.]
MVKKKTQIVLVLSSALLCLIGFYIFIEFQDKAKQTTSGRENTISHYAESSALEGDAKLGPKEPVYSSAKDEPYVSKNFSIQEIKNFEISPYPEAISATGLFSIYPSSPFKIYKENIDKALACDDAAQYRVALALRECVGVSSKATIDRLEVENEYYDLIGQLKAHYIYCQDLIETVSIEKLSSNETHYEWMLKSHKRGNSQASAFVYSIHPERFEPDEALDIIVSALKVRGQDDINAYDALKTYIAHNHELSSELQPVIDVALCNIRDWCNQDVIMAYVEYVEKYIDAQQIRRRSDEVTELIKNNDISGLIDYLDIDN